MRMNHVQEDEPAVGRVRIAVAAVSVIGAAAALVFAPMTSTLTTVCILLGTVSGALLATEETVVQLAAMGIVILGLEKAVYRYDPGGLAIWQPYVVTLAATIVTYLSFWSGRWFRRRRR